MTQLPSLTGNRLMLPPKKTFCSRQIQEHDGLDGCVRIKQLYAQNNCIRSVEGSSLPHFKFLRELRLYDNKLKDLQGTLDVLSRLSHSRDLDLFGNAVMEEENYRLQVIRALPSLDVLDRHVITDEERTKAASDLTQNSLAELHID
ncbi:hypothetical protein PF005_g21401 [Phytophthora fragariae]|uniref:U2A'/phosphoprotein 32 family A C-terminal domain-containing protein n=1 Tax=Phytophthora fragariae TaxID=53985 RepID=A0A6A4BGB8_9STRA|nr:hypothetical protein PF005_g21401 [Phytophthora fragariae]KAE9196894.1 hypothetical protein PF004_g19996 [Phytophthora fragariae]KAE9272741.1 hypothetical protein PF001_g27803 [Phytophthora fragariae]